MLAICSSWDGVDGHSCAEELQLAGPGTFTAAIRRGMRVASLQPCRHQWCPHARRSALGRSCNACGNSVRIGKRFRRNDWSSGFSLVWHADWCFGCTCHCLSHSFWCWRQGGSQGGLGSSARIVDTCLRKYGSIEPGTDSPREPTPCTSEPKAKEKRTVIRKSQQLRRGSGTGCASGNTGNQEQNSLMCGCCPYATLLAYLGTYVSCKSSASSKAVKQSCFFFPAFFQIHGFLFGESCRRGGMVGLSNVWMNKNGSFRKC
mmetsp:Transcript_12624/g.24737  ORF Transcript_12624/g.24737 Transcript_12624/m.24737 type:complete len:260 (+) Transcript_12624:1220-1999(+)